MQSSTMSLRLGFSIAAATLSLSLICLLTSSSIECDPSHTTMSSLYRYCKDRSSLTRRHRPIRVAREQWGTVGVNVILIHTVSSSVRGACGGGECGGGGWLMVMASSRTTFNSSSVCGCSGSLISRIRSVRMCVVECMCVCVGGGGEWVLYWCELEVYRNTI